ncbi:MAG: DNA replication and repair protein RecF [Chlorobiaceae bacterium]|nr:DNA replication and repair protein RecF [Chlorobiaceae bacterium]
MRLESIRIANFRNHDLLEFEPGPSITVIHGRNGSGKTSILEAVHYCALTRGFSGSTDRDCLTFGSEYFTIRGSFLNDRNMRTEVRIAYSAENEKQVFVNEQELDSFSRHVGAIPCVTFTPNELSIVSGPPSERRRFIDSSICQYDRKYLADMVQYRRVLQQRNALLTAGIDTPSKMAAFDIWTEQIAVLAATIVKTRLDFIRKFGLLFRDIYSWFPGNLEPEMLYQSSYGKFDQEDGFEGLTACIRNRYQHIKEQEIYRRQTLAGPHRDDLQLLTDGHETRRYASQGEQRSYLIAMKMALRSYLFESTGEHPIILFDDLFSELDPVVEERIIDSLSSCGQVLITSTVPIQGNVIMLHTMNKDPENRD